ncbi:MAG: hypothetical protein R3F34_20055 [Planctomycetota bacterium]
MNEDLRALLGEQQQRVRQRFRRQLAADSGARLRAETRKTSEDEPGCSRARSWRMRSTTRP